ncbi:kinetochore Sim4 complex subunit FTA2-domain-containing protein [Xylaria scruposa]|nr:kinetochore Sim4 complex subunit FTA2-domain-containing protein [Xylaria scruposa]
MATPLPHRIVGPKLSPFNGSLDNIQFRKLLSSEAVDYSSGSIPHSRVFKVDIEGKTFALKVFNFFSIQELWPTLIGNEHLLEDVVVRHQLDPFFAECRAFGRLVEENKDDKLAVRCHGYIFLPRAVECQIEQQFGISDWNRVYNMDIRKANYLGGRLFDFSIAATVPHLRLSSNIRFIDNILEDMEDDLRCFDSMVKRERDTEELVRNQSPTWDKRTRAGTKS